MRHFITLFFRTAKKTKTHTFHISFSFWRLASVVGFLLLASCCWFGWFPLSSREMTEFPELGQTCGRNDCGALDFLPFECNACKLVYCLEHRSYKEHDCEIGLRLENVAFFCPECNASINVGYGGDVDEKFSLHLAKECPAAGLDPSKKPQQPRQNQNHPRCIVPKCKQKRTQEIFCKLCGKPVCLTHRFESDHDCESRKKQQELKKFRCPVCDQPLPVHLHEDLDGHLSQHLAKDCPKFK